MIPYFPEPCASEKEIRDRVRAITTKVVAPTVIEDDVNAKFRREHFTALAKDKLTAVTVDPQYGGAGLSSRCYYASLEEIARVSPALSVTVGVTNLIQGAIQTFGTAAQKDTHLRKLTSGEWLGAFSLSESVSGSDAAGLQCTAKKVDGGYVVNGTKLWCSNGGHADLYLLMARTDSHRTKGITSFLVPRSAVGFRVGKQEKKLGLRASTLAELVFEDCFLSDDLRLAEPGMGFTVALSQLDSGRIAIGSCGVAITLSALERATQVLGKEVTAEGWSFVEGPGQLCSGFLAEAFAVKALMALASDLRDKRQSFTPFAASIKLLGSDLAVKATSELMTLLGPRGVTRELELERMLRDAKALQIVEGTNQVQRLVLARTLHEMSL